MKYSINYILAVVSINLAFTYIPNFTLYDGTLWSIGSVIAGFVFVARDYAQREIGHIKVLVLMVVAGVISYIMSDPFVAIASMLAFSASELIDFLVYTFKKGSFKRKIIVSGLISIPIDTVIFLAIINHLSVFSFVVMTISKMLSIAFIYSKK